MQVLTTSKAVRDERVAAGMSQQALASRAGLALRTLVRIEGGEDCNVSTLTKIAEALEVPVHRLVGVSPCTHPRCTNEKRTTWHNDDPCPYEGEAVAS